jgi:Zn-dependent peptidase ImmA (M78 family)
MLSGLIEDASEPYTKHQEREADVFATEFLMPDVMVRPFCSRTAIDLAPTAETVRSSIVSAAVRYVELSPAPCAGVYSERGLVDWAKRSRSFLGSTRSAQARSRSTTTRTACSTRPRASYLRARGSARA